MSNLKAAKSTGYVHTSHPSNVSVTVGGRRMEDMPSVAVPEANQKQVWRAHGRLNDAIGEVNDLLDRLEIALETILRPVPGVDSKTIGEAREAYAPLASEIDNQALTVEAQAARLNYLLERLEI